MTADRSAWLWSPSAGYLAVIGACVCWGLSWAAIKPILHHISPLTLNWLQMLPVLAIAAGVHVLARRAQSQHTYPAAWLLAFGLIACIIFYTRNLGCQLTSPTTGVVIARLDVLFTALLSSWLLGVGLTPLAAAGGVTLLTGVALVIDVFRQGLVFHPLGYAVLVLCALGMAVNALIIKVHFAQTPDEAIVLASAAVQSAVFGVAVPAAGLWQEVAFALATPVLTAWILAVAMLIAVGLYLYYFGMKRAPVTNVRMLYAGTPAVTMLADHFWLGAAIGPAQVAGLAAVIGGAIMVILGTPSSGRPRPLAA